jgi:hypothetical protein
VTTFPSVISAEPCALACPDGIAGAVAAPSPSGNLLPEDKLAHHLRFVQPRALGRKSSDEFTVPLCRTHHRAVHRVGDEQAWWQQTGIDPIKVARKLWKHTRVEEGRIQADPTAAQVVTSDQIS